MKNHVLIMDPASGTIAGVNASGELKVTGSSTVSGTVSVDNFPASQTVDDGGGSLTVDGTVSVSNFPATQAVSIAAVVSVDDNGGSLTVDGTVVVSNFPATQTVDGAVSVSNFPATYPVTDNGGSLTVDGTVAATQSGSWNVGVTSVIPGTAATNLGKAEDAAHTTGDTGVMSLAVRKDGKGGLVDTEGDYAPMQVDSNGHLKVIAEQSSAWTVGVSSVIPGTGSTNLGKAEDSAHTSGDTGVMPLAVRNDSASSLVSTNGDYAPLQVDSEGALIVVPFSGDPANFTCTVRLRDGINSADWLSVIERGEVNASFGNPNGITPMALVTDDETAGSSLTLDRWECLSQTVDGLLRVTVGAAAESIGKYEDVAHATGDTGAFILSVRQDTLSASAGTDGDYAGVKSDERGALWIRNAVMLEKLSDSTDGTPIQITGTATGTANDLHDSTANEFDRVTLDATNTGDAAVKLTIEWGGTGTANEIVQDIPARATIRVVNAAMIGGDATVRTISAYAGTASVINIVGFVERNV